jgi:DNA polymerase
MTALREDITALEWYVDAGVDEAIDDTPRNYFAVNAAPQSAPAPQESKTSTPIQPARKPPSISLVQTSLAETIAQARRLADAANTLEDLRDAVASFEGCTIKKTANKTVFGDGNPGAKLMLIGEAPGADEDREGIPFCGVSGKLLDKMLAAIGYDRRNYYITNTVFWRPPGNRQPSTDELAICRPFVEKSIALVNPELLVLVGGVAAKALLETEQSITRLRGKNYTYRTPYENRDYCVTITYHPSYLLRQPAAKRAAWQDLLAVRENLGS